MVCASWQVDGREQAEGGQDDATRVRGSKARGTGRALVLQPIAEASFSGVGIEAAIGRAIVRRDTLGKTLGRVLAQARSRRCTSWGVL